MDRLSLKAKERTISGKKVKHMRKAGEIPGNVYGNTQENEQVSVTLSEFLPIFRQAGETGLINLKIGEEKVRPVLVREIQHDPRNGQIYHIDFYQVNLKEKVKVKVPIELIGEEVETVKLGETVVLQNLHEIEVEALPTDLIEKIEVDITPLQNIDDGVTVGQLNYNRELLTVFLEPEEIVVKLAPAITEEMKKLLEEQEAEAAEAAAEQVAEEGAEGKEGEETAEGAEGETGAEAGEAGEAPEGESKKEGGEEKPKEEEKKE